ncbi:MAG: N-acetyltransferase [Anaerolineales bacterium]|nr:N-acetyltransferase [Anaerolineales bacterium]
MPELTVSKVENAEDMNAFLEFPWKVYEKDPYWVPPLISERRDFHNPGKNPFFEHATVDYFIARRGSEVVGTIASFTNDLYNEFQGTNVGFFGFFEVLEDAQAAQVLLSIAVARARDAGHESILGPAQFSTNDEVGLLVDGFDDVPRILMTYNPPRYMDYIEGAGFQKAMDLLAYELDLEYLEKNLPEKLIRVTEKVREREKYHLRKMDMKNFDDEVEHVKKVYNKSWERNWGFVPMTDGEIDNLAESLKPLLDTEIVVVIEQEGEVIGFSLPLPDLNQPLLKAYPRPGTIELWTMLKFIWHWKVRRQVDWVRAFALGVLPEHRGTGADALLYIETAKAAFKRGYKMVEMSWVLENNDMTNRSVRMLGGEVYKTYRVYEKQCRE